MSNQSRLWRHPEVRHRLEVGGYARITGNISRTAERFRHDRKTVREYLRRYKEFMETGDLTAFLNQPRGDTHRTADWIEEEVVAYYQEEDTERTCPNIAHALAERGIPITRQTVYNILRRRGVWIFPQHEGRDPIIRFEEEIANATWQIDLIEGEETALGKVYALVIVDDHSRYLLGLFFFLTKEAEPILYAVYQVFLRYGLPVRILVDRGSQFYAEGSQSTFQLAMARLGVEVLYTSRPQTKGKVEKLNQYVERDFLGVWRKRVQNLEDLNARAEQWRQWYNRREHEGMASCAPEERYQPSPHRLGAQILWDAFAREERRKVHRDGMVHINGQKYPVPKEHIGTHVWVRSFGQEIRICTGEDNRVLSSFRLPLPPPGVGSFSIDHPGEV